MTDPTLTRAEAGRELDALIAQRVFGIQVQRSTHPSDEGEYYDLRSKRPGYNYPVTEIDHYSRDIEAAWQVAEMLSAEWFCVIHSYRALLSRKLWVASFFRAPNDRDDQHFSADAPTAPLAICRAALKALDHE